MKKRVISAAIMVIIVAVVFLLPANLSKFGIALAAGLLSALAYKETLDLKESHKPYPGFITALGLICTELVVFSSIKASYIYNGFSFAILGIITLALLIPSIFDKKGKRELSAHGWCIRRSLLYKFIQCSNG